MILTSAIPVKPSTPEAKRHHVENKSGIAAIDIMTH